MDPKFNEACADKLIADHVKNKIRRVVAKAGGLPLDLQQLHAVSDLVISYHKTIMWIASQQDLFFAECSQAEEIVKRCRALL